MLVDSHCHIHDAAYDSDRTQIINNARKNNIKAMVTIGCDIETSLRAQAVSLVHPDIFYTVGIHPHEAQKAPSNYLNILRPLALHPRCIGIGECGLDYYYEHSPKDTQRKIFHEHIQLSLEMNKTLIVHVRDAWDECIQIIKSYSSKPTVLIHCFTGNATQAQQFVDLGCFISISGIVTFANAKDLQEAVQIIPLEQIMIETDAPYLAPIPNRGKRNEPAWVSLVAQKIAELKQLEFSHLEKIIIANFQKIFYRTKNK